MRRAAIVGAASLVAMSAAGMASASWLKNGAGAANAKATALVAPTNPGGSTTSTSATVTWSAPASGPAPTKYTVKRGAAVVCGHIAVLTCTETGLTASQSYTYNVFSEVGSTPWVSSGSASTTLTTAAAQAAATKFAITSAAVSGQASSRATLGSITVQQQDSTGNPVTAGAGGVTVNLASDSRGAAVFALTSGAAAVTSVTIPSGSSSVSFFYGDTKAGRATITASGALTSATQQQTITAGGVAGLAFMDTRTTLPTGASLTCGTISSSYSCSVTLSNNGTVTGSVSFVDAFGNPAIQSASTDSTIGLSAPSRGTVSPSSLTITRGSTTSSGTFTLSKSGSNTATTSVTFGSSYTLGLSAA